MPLPAAKASFTSSIAASVPLIAAQRKLVLLFRLLHLLLRVLFVAYSRPARGQLVLDVLAIGGFVECLRPLLHREHPVLLDRPVHRGGAKRHGGRRRRRRDALG